jgi:hypothetical protein
LQGDFCLAGNRREHPSRNFQALAYGIDNRNRTIAFLRPPEDPQPIAVKRMKGIKNLNVRDIRTQGIVRDDVSIRTSTAPFQRAGCLRITAAGYGLAILSFWR